MSWKDDAVLVEHLRALRASGNRWSKLQQEIAENGFDIPDERSLRRLARKQGWHVDDPAPPVIGATNSLEWIETAALFDASCPRDHAADILQEQRQQVGDQIIRELWLGKDMDTSAFPTQLPPPYLPGDEPERSYTAAELIADPDLLDQLRARTAPIGISFDEIAEMVPPGEDEDPQEVADHLEDLRNQYDMAHPRSGHLSADTFEKINRLDLELQGGQQTRWEIQERVRDGRAELRAQAKLLLEREDQVVDLLSAARVQPPPQFEIRRQTENGKTDVFVLIGDAHVGKLVEDGDQAPGIVYNHRLFLDNLQKLTQKLYDVVASIGTNNLGNLHLCFAGDNMDGMDMRPGHPYRVEFSIGEQEYRMATAFASFTAVASALGFLRIHIAWVIGNHGRVRRRLDDNKLVDNHEYRAGRYYKALVAHLPNVEFHLPQTEWFRFSVKGRTYEMEHLHNVKGGKNTPIHSVIEYHRRRAEVLGPGVDTYLGAHFHQGNYADLGNGRELIMAPPWDNGDDFVCGRLGKANTSGAFLWTQDGDSRNTNLIRVNFHAPRPAVSPVVMV